jgi:hypothetical protein
MAMDLMQVATMVLISNKAHRASVHLKLMSYFTVIGMEPFHDH